MMPGTQKSVRTADPSGITIRETNEESPLLYRATSPGYGIEPPGPEEIADLIHERKHFNLAGLSSGDFWVLQASLWMCSFINAFDGLIVATLLGPISSSFHSTNSASWLGTSYMLAVCCVTPIYGRLCDILGRRDAMLIALSIFGTGNFLCAVAPSMNLLIAARALAGMGGGGMSTIGSTITSDLIPIHLRGIFQGLANIAFGLGSGLGAPIGGMIYDRIGWRPAFGLQIPLFILCGTAIYNKVRYTLPSKSRPGSGESTPTAKPTIPQLLKKIDWTGCILLAGWVGSMLTAVSLKTSSTAVDAYLWTSPTILGLFGASIVLFVLFLVVELKWAANPVMPFELLHSRTPIAVSINNFAISVVMFGTLYSVPMFYTAVRQMSASTAGSHMLPNGFASMIGSLATGFIVRHTGRYYWLNFGCGLAGLFSCAVVCTWSIESPGWLLWVGYIPMAFSAGGVTTLTIVGLIADIGREHIAVATSLSYVSRTLGQVLGVSLSGALLQLILQNELSARITGKGAQDIIASIRESSDSIKNLPPAIKAAAILSYQRGLQGVFIAATILTVISIVAALFMRDINLNAPSEVKSDEERLESEE